MKSTNIYTRVGVPAANPRSQLESTTYLRVFAASRNAASVLAVSKALGDISLKHFSGMSFQTHTLAAKPEC